MRQDDTQVLTTTLRLPDSLQLAALRLLEVSRLTVNEILAQLWGRLDAFGQGKGPAWKEVTALVDRPAGQPSRIWRCEAETVGRILRAQASRKTAYEAVAGVLSVDVIVPAEGGRKARKNRRELSERMTTLREHLGQAADKYLLLLNVGEQICNFYLEQGEFPKSYAELQAVPVLEVGLLTLAGDDGPVHGQAYQYVYEQGCLKLRLKAPTLHGDWGWLEPVSIELGQAVKDFLARGRWLAPQLRAMVKPDGELVAVLDLPVAVVVPTPVEERTCERLLGFDWGVRKLLTMVVVDVDGQQITPPVFFNSAGFDGKQARLRRHIDQLKAKRDRFDKDAAQVTVLQAELDSCWLAYGRRNRALAHLASNLLIMVALAYHCQLIVGEDLASLKTLGQGRDVKGRWRNWRNNTTLRSAMTDLLRYKTRLAGLCLRFEFPRGTSHTCPRCGKAAHTFKSPALDAVNSDWGAWLRCENPDCRWNGSRDYAGALNVARLGVAYVLQRRLGQTRLFRMTSDRMAIQPVSYTGTGAALPFPPQRLHVAAPAARTRMTVAGWPQAVWLRPWPFLRPGTGQCVDSYT